MTDETKNDDNETTEAAQAKESPKPKRARRARKAVKSDAPEAPDFAAMAVADAAAARSVIRGEQKPVEVGVGPNEVKDQGHAVKAYEGDKVLTDVHPRDVDTTGDGTETTQERRDRQAERMRTGRSEHLDEQVRLAHVDANGENHVAKAEDRVAIIEPPFDRAKAELGARSELVTHDRDIEAATVSFHEERDLNGREKARRERAGSDSAAN